MNWRQFSVAMVQALAWPAVVLVVLLMYRQRLAQLLGDNLRRLAVGPIEAEWGRVAEETRATIEAAEALPALEEGADEPSDAQQWLIVARALVRFNPIAAISYGWRAAREAFEKHLASEDEEFKQLVTVRSMLKLARERGLVNPGAAVVLDHLRTLWGLALHPRDERQEPRAEQAEEYLRLVEAFLALLDQPARAARPSLPAERGQAEARTSGV
ncbi:hypothetical protein [Micromonospora sp. NPDC005806]|uniref:hypothetical protein n=1 Tax=Micromonospora sp. NPDC005806 TaxID=3364234 RepID=UPI003677CB4F